jgi:UDP-N-acetylmuramoyl-tripeptide--D-alanyl-D-alanine ligase
LKWGCGQREKLRFNSISCPTIGVITNVGTAHIGRLVQSKRSRKLSVKLLAEMPSNSVAILNTIIPINCHSKDGMARGNFNLRLEGGDLRGQLIHNEISVDGMQLPLPLPGRHNASNFLAALAVAKVLQIDWSSLTAG